MSRRRPHAYAGCGCSGPFLGCSGCMLVLAALATLLVLGLIAL